LIHLYSVAFRDEQTIFDANIKKIRNVSLDKMATMVGMDEKIWKKLEIKRKESGGTEKRERETEREKERASVWSEKRETLLVGHPLQFCSEKLMTISDESNPKVSLSPSFSLFLSLTLSLIRSSFSFFLFFLSCYSISSF